MEVRAFERMRVGRKERDVQEVSVMLRPITGAEQRAIAGLDGSEEQEPSQATHVNHGRSATTADSASSARRIDELSDEVERLRSELTRAKQVNERMWTKIVDKVMQ